MNKEDYKEQVSELIIELNEAKQKNTEIKETLKELLNEYSVSNVKHGIREILNERK
tara:strand:- start:97 stop:264 length:168 start_codon:yes stop_codon:yes gene_type:complete